MKVLIVDRDYGAQRAYMAVARSSGWMALPCKSVPEAVDLIRDQRIDALILAHSKETQLGPLRDLRLAGVKLPVILLSTATVDRDEARKLGAGMILSKPPNVSELRSALSALEDSEIPDPDFAAIFRFLERCGRVERPEAADSERYPDSLPKESSL